MPLKITYHTTDGAEVERYGRSGEQIPVLPAKIAGAAGREDLPDNAAAQDGTAQTNRVIAYCQATVACDVDVIADGGNSVVAGEGFPMAAGAEQAFIVPAGHLISKIDE